MSREKIYQFKLMPFGLTNAPSTFQRLKEKILAELQWEICLVYINDIIILSQTIDQHVTQLGMIFSCLKPKNCKLFRKVQYLGLVVSDQGTKTVLQTSWRSSGYMARDIRHIQLWLSLGLAEST